MRDELEKEQRAARAVAAANRAAAAASQAARESATPETPMPGSGHILGLTTADDDEPPAYDNANTNSD